jgi:hypothetical protein
VLLPFPDIGLQGLASHVCDAPSFPSVKAALTHFIFERSWLAVAVFLVIEFSQSIKEWFSFTP